MSNFYAIDVDLDVFKALTAKLEQAGQSHNDVLRDLLGLDSPMEADSDLHPVINLDAFYKGLNPNEFYSRGLRLPSGTELRARYKGKSYFAKIAGGKWFDENGHEQTSPSSAANAITGTTVNGWRFWEAKRPGDPGWLRLDVLNAK